jgi:splicing factor 3B subunit 2
MKKRKVKVFIQDENDEEQDDKPSMNRKQRKEAKRMKVAYLKSIVKRPDLCEGWDVTAPDPILLLYLKAYKNTI